MSNNVIQNVVDNLFPTPVYISDCYKLSTENKNSLIKETIKNNVPNLNGNITSANNYILDIPYLSELKNHLLEQINNYVYEVLSIVKSVEVYITQSWININYTDTSHHPHHHPNSFISGTYYLKGDTPISFMNDNRNIFQNYNFDFAQKNFYNQNICDVKILEGRCLLFPSTLNHFVKANENKEDRVSLSFNTFIKGTISNGDTQALKIGD